MSKQTNRSATEPEIDIQSVNFNLGINYTDKTDPDNPKSGNYSENVNLNFTNDSELNRVLIEKPYLQTVVPLLIARLLKDYDPENTIAKQLKDAIKPPVAV